MNPIISSFNTPAGKFDVEHDGMHIHRAYFSDNPFYYNPSTDFCRLIGNEINTYFNNPRHRFQLTLKPQGSTYQLQVWNALLVIPVGRTLTYGELSIKLQSSPRAIGQACKNNPLALFIPCHRVVGKTNHGGYMGKAEAVQYKLHLLNHEGVIP